MSVAQSLADEFESVFRSAVVYAPSSLPNVAEFLRSAGKELSGTELMTLLRRELELRLQSRSAAQDQSRPPEVSGILAAFPDLLPSQKQELVLLEWRYLLQRQPQLNPDEFFLQLQLQDAIPESIVLKQRLAEVSLESRMSATRAASGPDIENYRIIRKLGCGGMGDVYEAEETQDLHRRVALKILRSDVSDGEIRHRFEAEGRILAILEHPHIARVFSTGMTRSGLPYFAMELVRGLRLSEYVPRYQLNLPDRLRLMIQICRAIHHVHQRGILHRDIKPSNVLVTTEGGSSQVKIIDFGVAKALSPTLRLSEQATETVHGTVIGSLQYMSPEQAGTDTMDMDVRSDVYSLGVVLYELLTGTTPICRADLERTPHYQLVERIRCEEPPRPATVILRSGQHPQGSSDPRSCRRLAKQVQGDLDVITMKALEKERSRRYDSAAHLAEDLERFLNGDVVLATAPSTWYRLTKIWHRHRTVLNTALVVFVASALAVFVMVRSLLLAREAQADARRALTDGLTTAQSSSVPVVLESLASLSHTSAADLRRIAETSSLQARFRARCGLALLQAEDVPVAELISDWIQQPAISDELYALLTACQPQQEAARSELRVWFDQSTAIEEQARILLPLLLLGDTRSFRAAVSNPSDRSLHTEVVQRIASLRGYTSELCRYLRSESDANAQSAVIQGFAESQTHDRGNRISDMDLETLRSTLQTIVRNSNSGQAVSSAALALRRMREDPDQLIRERPKTRNLFQNSAGLLMVRIPAGTFLMGMRPDAPIVAATDCVRGTVTTTMQHDFYVSDSEVTIRSFREFAESKIPEPPASASLNSDGDAWKWNGLNQREAPGDDYPAVSVRLPEALEYCNWLSLKEGRQPCYRREPSVADGSKNVSFPWQWDREANGYRLPTQAEWEYACRGQTTTDQFFGRNPAYTKYYAVYGTSHVEPARSRLPNMFGLCDTYGSLNEWCWDHSCDWILCYTEAHRALARNESGDRPPLPPAQLKNLHAELTDPVGSTSTIFRGVRGGVFWLDEASCLSGFVLQVQHNHGRDRGFGFRIVCNADD